MSGLKTVKIAALIVFLVIFTLSFSTAAMAQTELLTLKPGFNFISLKNAASITPASLKNLSSRIENIYFFDAKISTFLNHKDGDYFEMGRGKGYIVKIDSGSKDGVSVSIPAGADSAIGDITLYKGFNLTGFSKIQTRNTFKGLMEKYSAIRSMHAWDPALMSFINVVRRDDGGIELIDGMDHEITAGEACYMKLDSATTLNYDNGDITIGGVSNKTATPVFSQAGGSFSSPQQVFITCPTDGATIKYTLDGTAPSASNGTVYSGAITISTTSTIKAIAIKSGMADSDIASITITITIDSKVETPEFSPAAGAFIAKAAVCISTKTQGASVKYTLDNSAPSADNGMTYTSEINLSSTATVKAMASKQGATDSDITSAVYIIDIVSVEPACGSSEVNVNSNLAITFRSNVKIGSGNIEIIKSSDDSTFETIPVTDSAKVSVAGNVANIVPSGTLAPSVEYYVKIADSCFKDQNDSQFAGIVKNTGWKFTTRGASSSKRITAFNYGAFYATINETAKTIVLKVPDGISLSGVKPSITHDGISVSPASGEAHNFTAGAPETYTVTDESGATQKYAVTVYLYAENLPDNAYLDIVQKKIFSVSTNMEYSSDNGAAWNKCGGFTQELPNLKTGDKIWARFTNDDASKKYLGEVKAATGSDLRPGPVMAGINNWEDHHYGAPGDAMKVTMGKFFNLGTASCYNQNMKIRYYLSTDKKIDATDTLLVEKAFPYTCKVGEINAWVPADFTVPNVKSGTYYIGAIINATGVISEMNADNNISVPFDTCEFIVKDLAAAADGAFKIVNSWGVGFTGENKPDGYYWITYATMKKQQMPICYYINRVRQSYKPTVVAVFKVTHPRRDQAKIILGIGDPAAPRVKKEFQSRWNDSLYSGAFAFPGNNIVVDISEFYNEINQSDAFLRVENGGSSTGTIDEFRIECFRDYNATAFKTISGGTGNIAASGTTDFTAATKNAFTTAELQDITPPARAPIANISLVEEKPSGEELQNDMRRIGVSQPGVNYNKIVNGHGTGYVPPTIEEWSSMKKLRAIRSIGDTSSLPDSMDHSKSKYFPPVGNQGQKGSCTLFSTVYYIHTFEMARENNWDLTGTTWEGGYYGAPSKNLDKIFSPDFVYTQTNSGADSGSPTRVALSFLNRIGCATWKEMPYSKDDFTRWPAESAWREAAKYRCSDPDDNFYWDYISCGYFTVKTDSDINLLRTLISEGYCVSTNVKSTSPGIYQLLDANDVVDDASAALMETDHAQTIVGYKNGTAWDKSNPDK